MSTSSYLQPHQEFYPQSSDRKRTSSLINQLSSTSRQNLHVSTRQNIVNQGLGYTKIFKQNQLKGSYLESYQVSKQPQVTKLLAQNTALQQQISRQKQKYELQINQLRRNLSLKDELLDDCQKQIVNLKATYLKLIEQYEQFKSTEETNRRIEQVASSPIQKGAIISNTPEGNLIPLSIKTKRSGSAEAGKLYHGLIRGRV